MKVPKNEPKPFHPGEPDPKLGLKLVEFQKSKVTKYRQLPESIKDYI